MNADAFQFVLNIGIVAVLLIVGYTAGTMAERKHLARLATREAAVKHMMVTDFRTFPGGADPARAAAMCTGEAVIATDYFKTFFAKLKNLLGGEVKSYISLMDRARREAVLRMMEQAAAAGFDSVCNIRLDTVDIGKSGVNAKGVTTVCVVASGTAYLRPRG